MEKVWNRTKRSNNKGIKRENRRSFFGYKIQNNYDEIRNELKARKKDKASLNELTEILEKIETEKMVKKALKRVKEIEEY